MFLISFSITKISSWYFLKTKTPISPRGKLSMCFLSASYPRRLSKFLLTANLAKLLGAIKEIRGKMTLVIKRNLKFRMGELTEFPFLKRRSMSFLFTLFFLESIPRKVLDRQLLSALLASSLKNFFPSLNPGSY